MSSNDAVKKQSAEQTVPYAPHFIREIVEESKQEPVISPGEYADNVMAQLSQSDAWKLLKKYINDKRARLERLTRESMRADSFDLQNTGFRYMIFDQVDAFAQDIINRVENVARVKGLENDTTPTI